MPFDTPITRPSLALFGIEPWRAAVEFASHQWLRAEAPRADADGHPVIIFPGMGADGTSVGPLRQHCRSLGYDAHDWGRGFNHGPSGDVDAWLDDLKVHITALLGTSNQRATFIGWSLGGICARELAKLMRGRVRQVITIGTPFNARADHTNAGWICQMLSGSAAPFTAAMSARMRTAPRVPTTSIYSRSDGVVAWQTCLHERETLRVQDLEVDGSHSGLGWNRAVLQIVGDRLAQTPGRWRRYEPDATVAVKG